MVKISDSGLISITGESIGMYRLLTLKSGLKLEAEHGMQLTRGRSCYSIIKEEFGLKGNKKNVLKQFEEMLNTNGDENDG
tara:strand:+ start:1438 stop:1677 length:240 start_codon:yes stop_codon:yes gene_type:complete